MLNDDTSNLKAHLKSLHANLAATGEVDEELQGLLHQLDGDIRSLLERRAAAQPVDAAASGLAERTQALAARFAAEHPRMEPALRELSNLLANLGI